MALSGSTTGYYNNSHHAVILSWTATQDPDALTSTVTVKLQYWVEAGWNIYKEGASSYYKITCGGVTKDGYVNIGNFSTSSSNQTKTLATVTFTINHNETTGAASFSLSGSLGVAVTLSGTYYGTVSVPSKSFTLDTLEVHRDPVVSGVARCSGFGTITVDYEFKYIDLDQIQYIRFNTSVTGSGVWDGYTETMPVTALKGSITISDRFLPAGTRYTVRTAARDVNNVSLSDTTYCTTWEPSPAPTPTESLLEITNTTSFHIPMSKANNEHNGYIKMEEIIVNDSVHIPWTGNGNLGRGTGTGNVPVAQADVEALIAALGSTELTGTIKYVAGTYADSAYSTEKYVGNNTSEAIAISIPQGSFPPIVDEGQVTVTVDSATEAILRANGLSTTTGIGVQDFSTFVIHIPKSAITCMYGATIKSTTGGLVATGGNGSSSSVITKADTSTSYGVSVEKPKFYGGTPVIWFRVFDTRGSYSTVQVPITVLKYSLPTIEASVERDADLSTAINLQDLQVTWDAISNEAGTIKITNSVTIKWGYVIGDTVDISAATNTLSGYSITTSPDGLSFKIINFICTNLATNVPLNKAMFVFSVTDSFGKINYTTCEAKNSIPILRMLKDRRVAINSGVTPGNALTVGGNIVPNVTGTYDLGGSNYRYNNIYLAHSPNVSSDERLKDIFGGIPEALEEVFMEIEPIRYKLKNTDETNHDRIHFGFSAQQVNEVMSSKFYGIDEYALVGRDKVYKPEFDEEPNWRNPYEAFGISRDDNVYNIAYMEMIALNTHMIQKLARTVKEQEETIKQLRAAASL